MRHAPLVFGVALGTAAIVLAWSRGNVRSAATGPAPVVTGPVTSRPVLTAAPAVLAGAPATDVALRGDVEALRARGLWLPIAGFDRRALRDDFADARRGHVHEAIDLLAPRGTPVLAVDEGFVAKLFTSARGGLTVYQFDPGQTYCYYYAHLDGYAAGLREGAVVHRGMTLGFVGTTGNAPPQTPHLHFAIFRLGPERHWWQGTPINPFAVLSAPG